MPLPLQWSPWPSKALLGHARLGLRRPAQATCGRSTPQRDTFRADALLDLRGLNEPIAGQSGFIRLSADKNGIRARRRRSPYASGR